MRRYKRAEELPVRKHVLVGYGDTTGYSSWSRRVEEDAQQFLCYMKPLSQLFTSLRDDVTIVKKFADGCLMVIEVDDENFQQRALLFIKKCITLCRGVKKILKQMNHPRPKDFRIRGLRGPAWKWRDQGEEWDYYSKTMNDGRHFLAVAKDVRIVLHDNIMERVSKRLLAQHGICCYKLPPQPDPGANLDKEDLELLHKVVSHGCSKNALPAVRRPRSKKRR